MRKLTHLFMIIILLHLLTACAGTSNNPNCTPTIDSPIVLTTQQQPMVATPSPAVSSTNTPATTVLILPPSLTPLAKLSPNRARDQVLDLLENNSGCELPCYWGITPGETTWQGAQHFLASFAEQIEMGESRIVVNDGGEASASLFVVYNTIQDYDDTITSSYWVTNGIVDKISVLSRGTELRYQLHQILTRFGAPDEVLLFLLEDTSDGKPWFSIYVLYVDRGVTAIYSGEAQYDGELFKICPTGLAPKLTLIPPGSKTLYWMKRDAYDAPFRIPSINDFPDKDIPSFHETMKVPGACLIFTSSTD